MTSAVAMRRRGHRGGRKCHVAYDTVPAKAVPLFSAGGQQGPGEASLRLELTLVLAAVKSLYSQELKPFGRILRKRVAELATEGHDTGATDVDVDAARLMEICKASSALNIQEEEGGDWSVLLDGLDGSFVDVYSPVDPYTDKLWSQVASHFASLEGDNMILPGGRYACALELIRRGPPFFANCSVGQVCHIVQLAISQKKMLGYLNGSIVPYKHSLSIVKEQCAASQQPSSQSPPAVPFATWESAHAGLQSILRGESNGGEVAVPLSNIKRLFRSQLHMELSETMLGHSKLSDLLQDQRFADICTVRLERNGYFVTPRANAKLSVRVTDSKLHSESIDPQPMRISLNTCVTPGLPQGDVLAEVDGVPLTEHLAFSRGYVARSPAVLKLSTPLVLGFCIDDGIQEKAAAGALTQSCIKSNGLISTPTADAFEGSSDDESTACSRGSVSSADPRAPQWGFSATGKLPAEPLAALPPHSFKMSRPAAQKLLLAGLL